MPRPDAPLPTAVPPRRRVKKRRRVLACDRCHQRKIRCDNKIPACSACASAREPCMGVLGNDSNIVVPRSIVQYLEELVARKEPAMAKTIHNPTSSPSETRGDMVTLGGSPAISVAPRPTRTDRLAEAVTTPLGFLECPGGFPAQMFFHFPSHVPPFGPVLEPQTGHPEARLGLSQVPMHIAELLVQSYIEKILPMFPYVDGECLQRQFHRVYPPRRNPADYDVFVISMVLSITTMSSRFRDSSKIASTSQDIFKNALNYAGALYETSIASLQGVMLLIQYSWLMPDASSLWHLVSHGMRMAVELGLHRDPVETIEHGRLSDFEVQMRRRIFWVMYEMDRSVSATSHQPFGVADDVITTKLPTGTSFHTFLTNSTFRQIQSEIMTVQFLAKDTARLVANACHAAWVEDIDRQIRGWQDGITAKRYKGPEWYKIAAAHGLVFLHRPCPRCPQPSASSLVICFEAAIVVAEEYWEHAYTGFLKYSWHVVHHGFEAAISMLYALRKCPTLLKERLGSRKILDTVHRYSSLFLLMSERWPKAASVYDTYERVKTTVIKETMQAGEVEPRAGFDELDTIILPDDYIAARSPPVGDLRRSHQHPAVARDSSAGLRTVEADDLESRSGLGWQGPVPLGHAANPASSLVGPSVVESDCLVVPWAEDVGDDVFDWDTFQLDQFAGIEYLM
ncbi:hypothetical protein PV04_10761 [Phialophora macrospora]|uniref:Zn(2)-C6 fungal-type domain-containing protein n=1 Tax=Phialophora macrospora TaxID=1851006 RepID=A0A0D2CC31_9EURO|nr:hypothetical protein PV04_10761 [Phialophora macrospora]